MTVKELKNGTRLYSGRGYTQLGGLYKKKIERLIDWHLVGFCLFSFSNFTFGFYEFHLK